MLESMDTNNDGEITWREAHNFYRQKLQGERADNIAYLAETTLADKASEQATQYVTETFQDGLATEVAGLDAAVDKALKTQWDEVSPGVFLEEKSDIAKAQEQRVEE